MSALIRGMTMPKNCEVCELKNGCEFSMPLTGRPFDCPIIEVPKGAKVKIEWKEVAVLECVD